MSLTSRGYLMLVAAPSLLLGVGCSDMPPEKGQLVVNIQTDMTLPDDVSAIGIRVEIFGRALLTHEYPVGQRAELRIPATLNIVEGNDAAQPVTISVWARQGDALRTLREVVTTVPPKRIADLKMPVQWLCTGFATEPAECPDGEHCITTTCPDGETCIAGSCRPAAVDSATLPEYSAEAVFGGASEPGDQGTCFNTIPCFAAGTAADVRRSDCTIPKPSGGDGTNVALVIAPGGGGICGPGACLVPLDGESDVGWRSDGNRIVLPEAVCQRLDTFEILDVAVTTECATKTASVPPCGPWSSVTSRPGSFDDPPPTGIHLDAGDGGVDCATANDGTPCGSSNDTECDRPDTCQKGECASNLTPEGEPCGTSAATECSAADSCDGDGACLENHVADGAPCDDCIAGAGNCGSCAAGACASECSAGTAAPPAVSVPSADGPYAMDATEVTNSQYCEFLAAAVAPNSVSGSPAECAWNDTYVPSSGWPAVELPDHPVVFVDWCDAVAYCSWKGQRLCGKIGGGPNDYAEYGNPDLSQWQNACSAGGTNTYSFGVTYDGATCNGQDYGAGTTLAVASATACEGGYSGLFDLSGNVFEWEDSCDGASGASDTCRVRGGSFLNPGVNLACGNGSLGARANQTATVGFRCCE